MKSCPMAVLANQRTWHIECADVREYLRSLPENSVHTVCTSPPYWSLRDYKIAPTVFGGDATCQHTWGGDEPSHKPDQVQQTKWSGNDAVRDGQRAAAGRFCKRCGAWRGQLGLEPTSGLFVDHLVDIFREVRRVLRDDGICWVNLGDSYSGYYANQRGTSISAHAQGERVVVESGSGLRGEKTLDMVGIPWQFAIAARNDGWYLRGDIVWCKSSPMPESIAGTRWEQCRKKIKPGTMVVAEDSPKAAHARHKNRENGKERGTFQDDGSEWADCPGCKKCSANGGLVLRRGSWRHTRAHEFIFQLTKSTNYYADQEAVRTSYKPASKSREQYKQTSSFRHGDNPDQRPAVQHDKDGEAFINEQTGANPRSWAIVGPEPQRGRQHFASYPTELVRPLIQVSTSLHGCCPACGSQYARILQPSEAYAKRLAECRKSEQGSTARRQIADEIGNAFGSVDYACKEMRTMGWKATCDCNAGEPVPAVILDPFAGTGTTLIVARRLGLRALGCDVAPRYVEMANERIRNDAPMLNGG